MARTEKKFGQVAQISAESFSTLIPTVDSGKTLNVLINIAARASAKITASTFTGTVPNSDQVVSDYSSARMTLVSASLQTAQTDVGSPNGISFNKTSSGIPSHAVCFDTSGAYQADWCSVSGKNLTTIGSLTNVDPSLSRFAMDPDFSSGAGDYSQRPSAFGTTFLNDSVAISTRRASALGQIYSVTISSGAASVISSLATTELHWGTYSIEGATPTSGYGYNIFADDLNQGTNAIFWGVDVVSIQNGVVTSGRVSWQANTSATDVATRRAVRGMSFFSASDYNTVHSEYVFSHPTFTTTGNTYYGVTSQSASTSVGAVTLPAVASTSGFRIVSATGTNRMRRMFDGTITYPPAPTGVTLPSDATKNQVTSLKFSPNGKYLACAYLRTTVPTNTAESLVVVYERDSITGAYSHIASSGSVFPRNPINNDCMKWTPDGGAIIVTSFASTAGSTSETIAWAPPGVIGESIIKSSVVTSWTNGWTKNPPAKHATAPSVHNTKIASASNAAVSQTYSTATSTTTHNMSVYADTDGSPIIALAVGRSGGNSANIVKVDISESFTGTIGTGDYSSYSNTVVGAYSVTAGSVNQISNIILNPGESLQVESSDANAVDISAYGVEIT